MTEASAASPAVDQVPQTPSVAIRQGFASREAAVVALLAAIAWLAIIAVSLDMGNGTGTMGLALWAFVGVWALMMTAMMLPSVAPVASLYVRAMPGTGGRRWWRLALFVGGYLLVWTTSALPAYLLLRIVDGLVAGESWGRWIAATVFVVGGLYQLTPLKQRCLVHCRSPLGLLLHYGSYRGRTRDLPRRAASRGVLPRLLLGADVAVRRVRRDEHRRDGGPCRSRADRESLPRGDRLSHVFGIACFVLTGADSSGPGSPRPHVDAGHDGLSAPALVPPLAGFEPPTLGLEGLQHLSAVLNSKFPHHP